ncbi:MAG TPA: hypothetical protein VNE63_22165 [Candidatus Acidoferrales bacterium]|nr:hypothetical protein [Candidatus Acidoferrales bacterium]
MAVRGKSHLVGREERPTGKYGKRLVEEAARQGVETEGESLSMAEQQKLLEDDGIPTPSVQGDKILAKYVKPHFERGEDDKIFVSLEFSIALGDAHKKILDPEILDAWKFIERKHNTNLGGIPVPAQTIDLYLAPDMDSELHLTAAEISSARLSHVEKTVDGKTEKITRLQFRVVSEITKSLTNFATTQVANPIWIRMQAAQGALAESA